jgi:hypothetical protein
VDKHQRIADSPQHAFGAARRSSIVGIFACAAALLAAVLADALVEGISNSDIVWHGHYTDQSSLDLLPVFLVAVLALILTLGTWLLAEARETRSSTRSLIRSSARVQIRGQITRLLPAIFALQIVVLFVMETVEQIIVYGHAFGGTLWLGGPVVISLLTHALVTVVCAFSLSSGLRALAKALFPILTCIFARYVAQLHVRPMTAQRRTRVLCVLQLVITSSDVERGPPLFALRQRVFMP